MDSLGSGQGAARGHSLTEVCHHQVRFQREERRRRGLASHAGSRRNRFSFGGTMVCFKKTAMRHKRGVWYRSDRNLICEELHAQAERTKKQKREDIDHTTDRVHAGKAARSCCLQTERAPRQCRQHVQFFITGAAHGNTSSRERLHFPVQPARLLLASRRIFFASCSAATEVFDLVTAPCTADAPGGLGGRRTLASRPH